MPELLHPKPRRFCTFDTVPPKGYGRGRKLVTENSTPVGSVSFLSARSPARLMRLQQIRPFDHLISSSVPELRWQQALPIDHGVDHFDSALFTRYFTLEHLADKFESAPASLVERDLFQHGPRFRSNRASYGLKRREASGSFIFLFMVSSNCDVLESKREPLVILL